MPTTFDGNNLLITLSAGITSFDMADDLYEPWKEWVLAGNATYPQAWRTIAGDDIAPSKTATPYFFIRNDLGWRIRPPAENGSAIFTGIFAAQDTALPVLVANDSGSFSYLISGLPDVSQTQGLDQVLIETGEASKFAKLAFSSVWAKN